MSSSVQQNMVSLEEPRSLVQQLVTKFYPENDVAVISNIDRAHDKVVQARQRELAESHEQLQGIFFAFSNLSKLAVWIKRVEQAKLEAQRPVEKSEMKHAERMSVAEKERFQLAKTINDQELAVQQLETSIANLKSQLAKLKEQNARLEEPELDVYALQLQLLASLKVSWADGPDGAKCMIKSRSQNDIHVFKLSDYQSGNQLELTKRIWEAVSNAP